MKDFIRKNKTKISLCICSIILVALISMCYIINYENQDKIKIADKTEKKATLMQTTEPEGYTGIYTEKDLAKISNNLSGKYILMADIDMSGKYYMILGQEKDSAFTGIFDGNGCTISNLSIDSDNQYVGMFGCIDGGIVKNVTLENINVKGTYTGSIRLKIGGLAGYITDTNKNALIENVHIKGINSIITNDENVQTCNIGGLIGNIIGGSTDYINTITIKDCTTEGKVIGNNKAFTNIGGLIANISKESYGGKGINIEKCSSKMEVINDISKELNDYNSIYMGGLLGYTGNIRITITECNFTGKILDHATTKRFEEYVGGVVGIIDANGTVSLNNSYSEAIIDLELAYGLKGRYCCVGGLIGFNNTAKVNECYSNSTVNINDNNNNTQNICIGGLIGTNAGEVNKSYSAGDINIIANKETNTQNYAIGGLIGAQSNSSVIDAYSTTDIKADLIENTKAHIGSLIGNSYSNR